MRASLPLVLGIALWLPSHPVRADVLVDTILDLNTLQIVPASGMVEFLSPLTAQVFVQAQDSLDGFDQNFVSVTDGSTDSVGTTPGLLASASGSATGIPTVPILFADAASNVDIPNIAAFASSSSNGSFPGSLSGLFEIVGTTGPVSVQFNAPLFVDQFLSTSGGGISASSEVIFNLLSPDINGGSPILFFDNPLSIGPNASASFAKSLMLTDSVTLQPDTPYFLIAEVDAESSGLNVLEPSFFAITTLGLSALLAAVTLRRKRFELTD